MNEIQEPLRVTRQISGYVMKKWNNWNTILTLLKQTVRTRILNL